MSAAASLTLAAALSVAFACGAAASPADDPSAGASITQFAYATNIVRIEGHDYMIIAGAERVSKPGGRTRTTAYAKRSRCATLEKKYLKIIACAAFVFPHNIRAGAFDFDPLLESARLRLPESDGRTRLRWTGRGAPSPDAFPDADPQYGASAEAELRRGARATGEIVGIGYKPRNFGAFALLIEGAEAHAYEFRGTRISRTPGGALKVRAVYRIPR